MIDKYWELLKFIKGFAIVGDRVTVSKELFLELENNVREIKFEIFKTCGFVEESGHGVPTVTKAMVMSHIYLMANL